MAHLQYAANSDLPKKNELADDDPFLDFVFQMDIKGQSPTGFPFLRASRLSYPGVP